MQPSLFVGFRRNEDDNDMTLRRLKTWALTAIHYDGRSGHMAHMRAYPADGDVLTREQLDEAYIEQYGIDPAELLEAIDFLM